MTRRRKLRRASSLLATAVVATLFIICSLGLTILSNQKLSPEKSLIDIVDENLDKDAPKIPNNNN